MQKGGHHQSNIRLKLRGVTGGLLLAVVLYSLSGAKPYLINLPEPAPPADSPKTESPKLKYPLKDRTGDFVTDEPVNPFYLPDPSNISKKVEYDPESGKYVVTEMIGDQFYRPPVYLSFEEYMAYTEKQEREQYFRERSNAINLLEEKNIIPPIQVRKKFFDKLFGGSKIEVRPQGNVEVILGGNRQVTQNPNIPLRNRKVGGFDFDQNINMNVIAKIGEKLQTNIRYNTQSGFDFQNQLKLEYAGDEDDIIKKIEAGNVSLPLPTRLINGSQTLFGFKAQLQFGRLTWTSLISQQQARRQSVTIQSGALIQNFEVKADMYDENRHFFLAQHFGDNYDKALSTIPIIRSTANITRMEVWITNRTGATQNVRDVVAFQDLGETNPYSRSIQPTNTTQGFPDNGANNLYGKLAASPSTRFVNNTVADLQGSQFGLRQGEDFERTYARKLNPNEYTFEPRLGYLSLNTQLNPNEALAVAYQYEVNGKVYQVGEFANQIPPDSSATNKVLYLKLLRGYIINVNLPIWKLMMKNIYSLGAFNLSNEDFRLFVYYNDPGGGEKQYMPRGNIKTERLLPLLNLDNTNMFGDPQPDGLFDYLPGVTIVPQNGRLIFPVREPFGDYLRAEFNARGDGNIADQYVYDALYDSIKFTAQQFPEFNRFVIRGQYKGSNAGEISLGAFNIPRGSVVVTAGGQRLTEGTDYTVDYSLGRVTILNQNITNSGNQIKVDFENNNLFGFQTRTLFGTRLDYRVNNNLSLGATVMKMTERPFTQKVNLGDDPISNTILGFDVTYKGNAPWLTKALDKLPIYSTKEMSTINAYAEVAHLIPGHSKAIQDNNKEGQVYIDDFEGTTNGYDLKQPAAVWRMSSTPRGMTASNGREMFPESNLISDLRYGYNRAKLAWYRIDNAFFNEQQAPDVVFNDKEKRTNHLVRLVDQSEIFPNRPVQNLVRNIFTFDLGFYPRERGPYNFESSNSPTSVPGLGVISQGINPDGTLKSPETRWGGVMRDISNSNFEANNIEFVEFWMLDPFIYNPVSRGGSLYLHLGNVSEDILRDSRMNFENGLSNDNSSMDSTAWGKVPRTVPLVNAFDNDPNARTYQDVGFDGLSDAEEQERYAQFLQAVSGSITDPGVLSRLQNDPAGDNYRFFNDGAYDNEPSILARYKEINGPHGNSPVQTGNAATVTAFTNLPDIEDVNRDNSLNENEAYFSYKIDLFPGMDIGTNPYIISKQVNDARAFDGVNQPAYTWYQFRIPIRSFTERVGAIPDFKSIQFIRLLTTGWEDSAILRFATLELVRNQWRTYNLPLNDPIDNIPIDNSGNTFFNVASVGIEENSGKTPVNYVLPPDIIRQQTLGAQTNQFIQQNEQALATTVCNLKDGDLRAVFKNLSMDFRRYKRLKLFIHANQVEGEIPVRDKEVTALIRIGSDFKDNYYQYEVPLKITQPGSYRNETDQDRREVWPDSNSMEVILRELIDLKIERNNKNFPRTVPYAKTNGQGRIITIVGNPDIGGVKTIMLGIKNPAKDDPTNPLLPEKDDGQSRCVEVWFNEMRLTEFDEFGGTAAVGNVQVKLADLGNINFSAGMHTRGFGQIEQRINERAKDNMYQYDLGASVELGRFFPQKAGIRIPFYGSIAQTFSTPEFDPYQLDIPTKDYLEAIRAFSKDSARNYKQQIQTITTRKGYNFSNVRIVPQTKQKKPRIYDPGNFNFTYAYTEQNTTDPFIEENSRKNYIAQAGWNFAPQTKEFTPFKKLIKTKTKWLDFVKDFNFNIMPSNLGVTTDINREIGTLKLRALGEVDFPLPVTVNKFFRWNRSYNFKYNPFRSVNFEYTAQTNTRVDEPDGLLDTREKKKEMWNNFLEGGRNTNYTQSLNANYNIPINKLPLFDFVNANVSYAANYTWTAAPQVRDSATQKWIQNPLGNIINNTQNNRGKVDLNFKKLYDKVPFLKTYNNPNPTAGNKDENKKKKETAIKAREKIEKDIEKLKERRLKIRENIVNVKEDEKIPEDKKKEDLKKLKKELKDNRKAIREKRKEYRNKQLPPEIGISLVLRPLLSLKRASLEYNENKSTTLPGFMPTPRFIGVSQAAKAPDYRFAFGAQPGVTPFGRLDAAERDAWLDEAGRNGWISRDTLLNQRFTQTRQNRVAFTAQFEPFPDLKVDLNMTRDYTENHSQFFKAIDNSGNLFHLNPMDMGSYTITYLTANTFFKKIDSAGISDTYRQFEANRSIVSQRLAQLNPNSQGSYFNPSDSLINNEFRDGYGPKSQDVLIPAFLAAYTGKDARNIQLNPFKTFPIPNWRISYTGLSKFAWAKKIFTNVNITHGYNSTFTVNSFQTNLDYAGGGGLFDPSKKDSISGNFFTRFNMPSIVINEQFAPLIGVDLTFKNGITTRFDYRNSRTLTVNFADYQLIENKSTQITVGAGYRVKGLKLPIKIKGKKLRLDNDLNFRFDFSYRDNITINHRIDEPRPQVTGGTRTISVDPSIDYVVSNRLNIRIFLNRTRNIPRISSGFPTTNTRAGIMLRFSLGQ